MNYLLKYITDKVPQTNNIKNGFLQFTGESLSATFESVRELNMLSCYTTNIDEHGQFIISDQNHRIVYMMSVKEPITIFGDMVYYVFYINDKGQNYFLSMFIKEQTEEIHIAYTRLLMKCY